MKDSFVRSVFFSLITGSSFLLSTLNLNANSTISSKAFSTTFPYVATSILATNQFSEANFQQKSSENPVLSAMKSELKRTMDKLTKEQSAPYFVSYSVTETKSLTLSASLGSLVADDVDDSRIVDIDIRIGSYELDNTRQLRGAAVDFSGGGRGSSLPISDDENAIRVALWQATDQSYKNAVERFLKVKTNLAVKVKEEDSSADFSRELPAQFVEARKTLTIDTAHWRERIKRISALYTKDTKIYSGDVFFRAEIITRYFVSSEGSEIVTSDTYVRCFSSGSTKSDDGMSLPLYKSYFAFTPQGLPSEEQMTKEVREQVDLLAKLRTAPLMETFSGPAILSGEASGVFFHEIFGHRIEGHRQKDVKSSQTFKNLVGEKILPEFIDVVFDPTISKLGNRDIVGYYRYDDQGVKGQKVQAVEKGVFKNFLMSRSPINNFPNSNGHGRKQAGLQPVARQSNLLVKTSKSVSFDSLKTLLRVEAKKAGKEFGLYFVEISGGFTFTNRTIPNAFNVQPLLVYKIYTDGRPDEIVRGVDLIGTPLTTFSQISAAADDLGIFNGVCGAESGGVPVSASSPSLLVNKIEVQKKSKSQAKPPILQAPNTPNSGN